MAEEPENHTLRLLREMRADIEAARQENKLLHVETPAEIAKAIAEVQEEHSDLKALMKHTGLVKAQDAALSCRRAVETGYAVRGNS